MACTMFIRVHDWTALRTSNTRLSEPCANNVGNLQCLVIPGYVRYSFSPMRSVRRRRSSMKKIRRIAALFLGDEADGAGVDGSRCIRYMRSPSMKSK